MYNGVRLLALKPGDSLPIMAKIISLTECRELLQRVEAEALEAEPQEIAYLLEKWELDEAINEGLVWLEIARLLVYPPLYCIRGGKP